MDMGHVLLTCPEILNYWTYVICSFSFIGIFFKTMKRYVIVRVFVEWANNRRVKKSPPIDYIIPLIKSCNPVYEKKPVFFNQFIKKNQHD